MAGASYFSEPPTQVYYCVHCKFEIDEEDRHYCCDSCKRFIHIKTCSGLVSSEIKCMLLKERSLRFLCNECNVKFSQISTIFETVDQMKSEIEILKFSVTALTGDQSRAMDHTPGGLMTIEEFNDRNKRKKNVVLFGVEEPSVNVLPEYYAEFDRRLVHELLITIGAPNVRVSRIARIGREEINRPRPRPIKLFLESEKDVWKVVKNAEMVKRSGAYNNVIITPDRTKHQLTYHRQIKNELERRRQAGDINCKIQYIGGIPTIVPIVRERYN